MCRRQLDLPVDIHRLVMDHAYAERTLKHTEDNGDELLLKLSIEVAARLGILALPPTQKGSARKTETESTRYVVGPRG
jgi:hypothetical protein